MATYIALLRGINVGGNVLRMERLRDLWAELGFPNARTYVQSGNIVFEASGSASGWVERMEQRLAEETRLPVSVLLRSRAEWKRLVARNPFALPAGADRFQLAGSEVYLHCPQGYGKSKLANHALESPGRPRHHAQLEHGQTALHDGCGMKGASPPMSRLEFLALAALRERLLNLVPTVVPQDEWERRPLGAASACGVSLPHSALSSDGL
jgi:hypothetical protein